MWKYWVIFLTLFTTQSASADQYFGIYPTATLAEVKSIYPNGHFEELKPAWMNNDQKFIQIWGSGIEGTLSVIFVDSLLRAEQRLKPLLEREMNETLNSSERTLIRMYRNDIMKYKTATDDDRFVVDHIRWVPSGQLKLSKFIKRYGKPDKEVFDENMYRYKVYEKSRDIQLMLDDKDVIELALYNFTLGDYMCADDWRENRPCDPQKQLKPIKPQKSKKRGK